MDLVQGFPTGQANVIHAFRVGDTETGPLTSSQEQDSNPAVGDLLQACGYSQNTSRLSGCFYSSYSATVHSPSERGQLVLRDTSDQLCQVVRYTYNQSLSSCPVEDFMCGSNPKSLRPNECQPPQSSGLNLSPEGVGGDRPGAPPHPPPAV